MGGIFEGLLGGVEERVIGRKKKREMTEEDEMSREEVRKAINKVKVGKATGSDGIPGEVWKYGGDRLEEWLWRFCSRVWKGDGWPGDWREGEIVPIIKRGEGKEIKDYKGVTIMPVI